MDCTDEVLKQFGGRMANNLDTIMNNDEDNEDEIRTFSRSLC